MSRNTAPLRVSSGGTSHSLASRKASASFFALLGLSLSAAWIASCNDDSNNRACVPGETRLCADVGRCEGSQKCLPDGSGYGECDCTGPLRQPSTDVPSNAITPLVGRRCDADADCGEGLRCYTADSNDLFGGGPAGGYCSIPCTGDNACTAIDPQAQCVGIQGTQSVCLRTCRSHDPTSLAENKCLTRSDVVCQSEVALGQAMFTGARQIGWCFPQCGSNEDCPAGRVCDLGRGLCTTTARAGQAIGTRCETGGVDCAGSLCILRVQNADPALTEQFCSAPCVVGQPVGCGYGPSSPKREAGCLSARFGGILSREGIGDTGFCTELCDVDADCEQASTRGWVCVESDGARERFGRAGICDPAPPGDAGAGGDAGSVVDASSADGG
jgi:hypothetical protein